MNEPPTVCAPTVCALSHRGFAALGAITFRRSETDGTPVLALAFGDRAATVPLLSLQREMGIGDDSPDGRMLALVAASLDYVAGLRPGDPLPAEVTTGLASWEPKREHFETAERRLQSQLVAWLARTGGGARLDRLDDDPGQRIAIQNALREAASALGLANSEAVLPLVAALATELAYIEALREGLLDRVRGLAESVAALGNGWRGDSARRDALRQTQRLSALALRQIATRFDEIDGQTSEIISTLCNVDAQRVFIRSNRDWLHRSRRAWEPVLASWRPPPQHLDDLAWRLVQQAYHFLAPRFMPVQEWQGFEARRGKRAALKRENVLHW